MLRAERPPTPGPPAPPTGGSELSDTLPPVVRRDWRRDLGEGERGVVHRSLGVQFLFLAFVIFLAWPPLDDLWHVSRTPAADCIRVVDAAESRRAYRPVCMSAEELSRSRLHRSAGSSQDEAVLLLIVGVVAALGLVVASVARLVPRMWRHRGLRIPDD